jgi:hypothetical protein
VQYEQESHSVSDLSPDKAHDGASRPWRAPTVTRVSLEQTLFFSGSPTDLSISGASVS